MAKTEKPCIDSEIFWEMREDFDSTLETALREMRTKQSDEATITLKLQINLSNQVKDQVIGGIPVGKKEYVKPFFKHKVGYAIQIKDEIAGMVEEDLEPVYVNGAFVVQKADDGQIAMDELSDYSYAAPEDEPC